ncbi:hypothetical protein DIPPA_06292 [Diplonema papillatum]|nr:hypothetical protein DIPPA_06292 [Diplonema papillatum]
MSLCVERLNACADFIPVVGSFTRCVTGVAAFLLAVVVTLVTVAFAWLYARSHHFHPRHRSRICRRRQFYGPQQGQEVQEFSMHSARCVARICIYVYAKLV